MDLIRAGEFMSRSIICLIFLSFSCGLFCQEQKEGRDCSKKQLKYFKSFIQYSKHDLKNKMKDVTDENSCIYMLDKELYEYADFLLSGSIDGLEYKAQDCKRVIEYCSAATELSEPYNVIEHSNSSCPDDMIVWTISKKECDAFNLS